MPGIRELSANPKIFMVWESYSMISICSHFLAGKMVGSMVPVL